MKQWTNDDLILFYYQELDDDQSQQLGDAIVASDLLKEQYDEICNLLGGVIKDDVPTPRADLNQKIMANITELKQASPPLRYANTKPKLSLFGLAREKLTQILPSDQWGGLATASIAITVAIGVVFYMGRMSVEPVTIANERSATSTAEDQFAFNEKVSRRILLTNVSSHLETGERLLTMVSNSDEDARVDLTSRTQMLEEMIGFNRLYRRAAERSEDRTLVRVLQQMEIVLLQLYHTDNDTSESELKGIRSRLDDSDLLFKLKVTNKKIIKQIT